MSTFSQLLGQLLAQMGAAASRAAASRPWSEYPNAGGMSYPWTLAAPGQTPPAAPGVPLSLGQAYLPTSIPETSGPHLLPEQYGWMGSTRPLGPGEYVNYAGEGTSYDQPTVVQTARNQWTVVPTLFLVNGQPQEVNDPQQALQVARQTGLQWPTFPSEELAHGYVSQREAKWGPRWAENSALQAPLWRLRK